MQTDAGLASVTSKYLMSKTNIFISVDFRGQLLYLDARSRRFMPKVLDYIHTSHIDAWWMSEVAAPPTPFFARAQTYIQIKKNRK